MINLLNEGPMWRRGLAASVALVGACTVFVSVVLIVLGAVMTKALGSTPDALGNSGNPGAKQDTSLSTSAAEKGSTGDGSKQVGALGASKGQS